MGLLDWFRKSGPEPVGGYGQLVELFSGAAARSGVAVNARTALECSAVLACVRVIANGLAQVPFKLYRAEGRNRNPAVGHGLYELMDMAPNEFQTAFEFRHMLALHLCLTGNAYIWLNRVGGRIVEMLPYPPGCVSIERDGWELTYRITTQDKRYITVPRKDMWHVRWLSWDGVSGLDGVVLAREAIGLSLGWKRTGHPRSATASGHPASCPRIKALTRTSARISARRGKRPLRERRTREGPPYSVPA